MDVTRGNAISAFQLFVKTYDDKYTGTVPCLLKHQDDLLSFKDFPAAHGQNVRITASIESTFATIRHRKKQPKVCLSEYTFRK